MDIFASLTVSGRWLPHQHSTSRQPQSRFVMAPVGSKYSSLFQHRRKNTSGLNVKRPVCCKYLLTILPARASNPVGRWLPYYIEVHLKSPFP